MYLRIIICIFAYMKKLMATILLGIKRFSYWQENGKTIRPRFQGTTVCKHCGTLFQGNYCPRCGQSRLVSNVSKRGFVMTFMEAYPQLASAYCRTILELLCRPGYMVRDFFRGHRIIYSGPFKTFIITISIFALFSQFIEPNSQEERNDTQIVKTEISTDEDSGEKILEDFILDVQNKEKKLREKKWIGPIWNLVKKKAKDKGSMYLFVFVPLLALASKTAFRKRQFDGRKLIYAEHFMVFTYLYAIKIFLSIFCSIIAVDSEYPFLLNIFYAVWMYKGLYGWRWKETLRRMCWFLFLFLLYFLSVICVVASILIEAILIYCQNIYPS